MFGGPVSNPQEVTDSLKEKNNPVFQMIERLYAYAGEYVAQKQSRTATNREKNLFPFLPFRSVPFNYPLGSIKSNLLTFNSVKRLGGNKAK